MTSSWAGDVSLAQWKTRAVVVVTASWSYDVSLAQSEAHADGKGEGGVSSSRKSHPEVGLGFPDDVIPSLSHSLRSLYTIG